MGKEGGTKNNDQNGETKKTGMKELHMRRRNYGIKIHAHKVTKEGLRRLCAGHYANELKVTVIKEL